MCSRSAKGGSVSGAVRADRHEVGERVAVGGEAGHFEALAFVATTRHGLRLHLDARHWVYLVPLLVVLLLNERALDRDVSVDRWNDRVVRESCAGRLGVRLLHGVVADDLEDEVPLLV